QEIVDHARTAAPDGMPMWINEDNVLAGASNAKDYKRIIEYLIDNDAAPDGIGFQTHFIEEWGRVSNSTPENVFRRIDRFADLGLRLRSTEFDIDVGEDEAWQGELMRDYLTVMFSHPNMEAITLWGFWGGAHWRGENGALYRTDWTEKPSLTAYQSLVLDQWWTEDTGATDNDGELTTRAFKGDYEITVVHDDQRHVEKLVLEDDEIITISLPITVGLSADFNEDGLVDGADFLFWQRGVSIDPLSRADLGDWETGFGAPASSSAKPVAEPATMTLIAMALAVARPRRPLT
ncbi:MAG: endo-1,4-beta-xylanase, partial [Planctomycetota bacterium]